MSENQHDELPGAIAIIGMAGHFPQAQDLETFWQNLRDGKEVVSFFTEEELLASGVDPELIQNPNYVPARAMLENADEFDAAFFGYSPREAQVIDPQQRLFLECAWEALESAGYDPDRYSGPVGVFAGQSMNTYMISNILANPDVIASAGGYQVMISNDKDFLTTRVSYKLNLKGPSVNVQTACSTSLVAVHLACQSLLGYGCDIALAGGVSVQSPRKAGYLYQPGMIMSPDGHCRAFDHRGQGIVAGEGAGIVVLKRYAEALADGDTIHAIIRGSAINNDGALKAGFTAPGVDGQAEAILMAQGMGDVDPASITLIEAHGTGTELGDPVEISALTQAFRAFTQERQFCAISSVKTNMGHLDAAAGVAGLIKTVMALKHKVLPPNVNFERPNPRIDFEGSPFYVNTQAREWGTERLPRRAGVSSFGIGGTNAHVVLEEAEPRPEGSPAHPEQLLLFSARSDAALEKMLENFSNWLKRPGPKNLADAAYTLQVGRKTFGHRAALVVSSVEEGIAVLDDPARGRILKAPPGQAHPAVTFLFPGQGAQYVQMGRDLYEHEGVFRRQVDECAEILRPHLGLDLRELLYPAPDHSAEAGQQLLQTCITQPALFTMEYALAKLWMAWGIRPAAMIGHSIGEYVAACLAGVFSLEDGLSLVAARGRLMQRLPPGDMLSIPLPEEEILPLLGEELSLAVVNSTKMSVVSGPQQAVAALQDRLSAAGIACRRLHTSHAFHSKMMDPILEPFIELVRRVRLNPPELPYLSNLSGDWITAGEATDPAYWAQHLRSTVRFSQNLETVFEGEPSILLEVGPGQTLGGLARQHAKKPAGQVVVSSMRHPQDAQPDTAVLAGALARLWLAGLGPDWDAYHGGSQPHRIPLPAYPFERKRYWVDPKSPDREPGSRAKEAAPGLKKRADLKEWFYQPSWQRSAAPVILNAEWEKGDWLVFCDRLGAGQAIREVLEEQGQRVISAEPGPGFIQTGATTFELSFDDKDQLDELFRSLTQMDIWPGRILHLEMLTGEPSRTWGARQEQQALQERQRRGFYSLLALAQSLGDRGVAATVDLLVVCDHLQEVTGSEILSPDKATILGPCKVIPQEYPQISCRCVDVELSESPLHPGSRLIREILGEFRDPQGEAMVAYRAGRRWTQLYLPRPLPAADPARLPLRRGGVYLITGGLGGIGLALAKYLAQTVQARIALTGRAGLPERKSWQDWLDGHPEMDKTSRRIRTVLDLERSGAKILILQADAGDIAQMEAALAQVRQELGPIDGIIHAAGLPGDGIIQLKSAAQAQAVLAPKIDGLWNLDRLVDLHSLDFVLLCSSINAILGGAGQVDYTAANAFLDAFAAMKNAGQEPARVFSVNWGTWQETGMAYESEVPLHLQTVKLDNLSRGLLTSEGLEAFERILQNPAAQTVVTPVDLGVLFELSRPEKEPPAGEAAPVNGNQGADRPASVPEKVMIRPEVQSTYAGPAGEVQRKLVSIWQNIIGVEPVGIQDNFFELGGHSLMALQILSRIQDDFRISLPLRAIFETSTIAGLAERIEALLWIEQNREVPDSSADRDEFTL